MCLVSNTLKIAEMFSVYVVLIASFFILMMRIDFY